MQQSVAIPVPHISEEIVEVSQLLPLRRIQARGVEQIVDMPVPHLMDGIVGQVHSEIQEQVVEVIKMIPKELVQEHNCRADL